MAYPYLPGAQTEAFKGLSVLVGLMVSLGASNLVGQAASGLILTYGRVFRRGEYVRIAEHEGTVTELGVFATRIRTGLGEELTVSNSSILAATTKNYSRAVKGAGYVLDTTGHHWLRHPLAPGARHAGGGRAADPGCAGGSGAAGVSDGAV
jgi:small-conductance mechanosensitive channel